MRTTNKYVIVNAKCMPRLSKVGILLSVGILLEFASFACFTEAVQLQLTPDDLSSRGYDNIKRAGFVGMRGKKSDAEDEQYALLRWPGLNTDWPDMDKRAGFVGMRGKKSHDYENSDLLRYLALLHRLPQMKRQSFFQTSNQRHGELKRAGFVGMRGKKSGDEATLQKKAAFVGMRGRRALDEDVLPYIQGFDPSLLDEDEASQRIRRAGFVGMRG